MLNHEGSHSEYFQELCALAAGGQISEPEFADLQNHLQDCAQCRSAYADFTDLLHDKLPLADPELSGSSSLASIFSKNSSYRERFLARARKQGIAISQVSWRDALRNRLRYRLSGLGYTQILAPAMALLLVTVGVFVYSLRQSNSRYTALAADMAALHKRFSQQASPVPPTMPSSPETAPVPPIVRPMTDAELVKARQDATTAEARSKALEEQLQAAASELDALRAQRTQASDSRDQLEKKIVEAEQALVRAGGELQSIREERSVSTATITAQRLEIRELSAKLTEQTEILERERTLLAAGRDIHDLMGARNLHIVDVLDVDSKGKDRRAFGRVFYTEGKSLIFYAFDLGDRSAARRNASFQVWGARGPAQSPAQSMGIFFVDDQKQNRWVLKFEDPRVLAEIDSVFVTVERPGGSPRPTGRKFLYAYLKANPNHP
jgi:hypothetical protein